MIVQQEAAYPPSMSDAFRNFLTGLLCKRPEHRLSWPHLLHHPFLSGVAAPTCQLRLPPHAVQVRWQRQRGVGAPAARQRTQRMHATHARHACTPCMHATHARHAGTPATHACQRQPRQPRMHASCSRTARASWGAVEASQHRKHIDRHWVPSAAQHVRAVADTPPPPSPLRCLACSCERSIRTCSSPSSRVSSRKRRTAQRRPTPTTLRSTPPPTPLPTATPAPPPTTLHVETRCPPTWPRRMVVMVAPSGTPTLTRPRPTHQRKGRPRAARAGRGETSVAWRVVLPVAATVRAPPAAARRAQPMRRLVTQRSLRSRVPPEPPAAPRPLSALPCERMAPTGPARPSARLVVMVRIRRRGGCPRAHSTRRGAAGRRRLHIRMHPLRLHRSRHRHRRQRHRRIRRLPSAAQLRVAVLGRLPPVRALPVRVPPVRVLPTWRRHRRRRSHQRAAALRPRMTPRPPMPRLPAPPAPLPARPPAPYTPQRSRSPPSRAIRRQQPPSPGEGRRHICHRALVAPAQAAQAALGPAQAAMRRRAPPTVTSRGRPRRKCIRPRRRAAAPGRRREFPHLLSRRALRRQASGRSLPMLSRRRVHRRREPQRPVLPRPWVARNVLPLSPRARALLACRGAATSSRHSLQRPPSCRRSRPVRRCARARPRPTALSTHTTPLWRTRSAWSAPPLTPPLRRARARWGAPSCLGTRSRSPAWQDRTRWHTSRGSLARATPHEPWRIRRRRPPPPPRPWPAPPAWPPLPTCPPLPPWLVLAIRLPMLSAPADTSTRRRCTWGWPLLTCSAERTGGRRRRRCRPHRALPPWLWRPAGWARQALPRSCRATPCRTRSSCSAARRHRRGATLSSRRRQCREGQQPAECTSRLAARRMHGCRHSPRMGHRLGSSRPPSSRPPMRAPHPAAPRGVARAHMRGAVQLCRARRMPR